MATPKQISTQLPASAAAGGKKARGIKEKHVVESAKTLIRKHLEAEQELENPNISAAVSRDILEDLVHDATLQLYRRMLGRKCFAFAAYSTWRFVLSNVELCYIRCDPGDPPDEAQQDAQEGQHRHQTMHQKTVQQQLQQRQRPDTPQELGRELHEQTQQGDSQCESHYQEGVEKKYHKRFLEQKVSDLQEDYAKSQYHRAGPALWTCEEMPQLAPMDTWAPGGLTVESISSSTIAMSAVKNRKKWGSASRAGSTAHTRLLRKGKSQST